MFLFNSDMYGMGHGPFCCHFFWKEGFPCTRHSTLAEPGLGLLMIPCPTQGSPSQTPMGTPPTSTDPPKRKRKIQFRGPSKKTTGDSLAVTTASANNSSSGESNFVERVPGCLPSGATSMERILAKSRLLLFILLQARPPPGRDGFGDGFEDANANASWCWGCGWGLGWEDQNGGRKVGVEEKGSKT